MSEDGQKMDAPGVGYLAQECAQERGFPRAVWPNQGGQLAAMEMERDILQDGDAVERDPEVLQLRAAFAADVGCEAMVMVGFHVNRRALSEGFCRCSPWCGGRNCVLERDLWGR